MFLNKNITKAATHFGVEIYSFPCKEFAWLISEGNEGNMKGTVLVSPFNPYIGIWLQNMVPAIAVDLGIPEPWKDLGAIIHELGHICCTGNVSGPEGDFFGWEFLVAEKFGLLDEWFKSIPDYGVGDGTIFTEYKELELEQQSEVIEGAIDLSTSEGYIVNGEPIRVTRNVFDND